MKISLTLSVLVLFTVSIMSIHGAAAQTNIITKVVGTGVYGSSPDSVQATDANIKLPNSVYVDHAGNIYFTGEGKLRRVDAATGIIATIAGIGTGGFSGDGGPATAAKLDNPGSIAFDAANNIYIADVLNARIRKINATTGIITTISGMSWSGYTGNGGPATAANMFPTSIAFNSAGDLFVAEGPNAHIRKIDMVTGIITNYAGSDLSGTYAGNGGAATDAVLNNPANICFDSTDNLYVSDRDNNIICKISPAGIITKVAGWDSPGFYGDGGPATAASLFAPAGLSIDKTGNLVFADANNSRVRSVNTATGIITTIVGNGTPGSAGDGGSAINARLEILNGICVDDMNRIYLTSRSAIRRTGMGFPTGVIDVRSVPLVVFPNPSNGIFRIPLANATPSTILVCNSIGRQVLNTSTSNYVETIDLGNEPDGIYFVSVTSNGNTNVHRIVLKH